MDPHTPKVDPYSINMDPHTPKVDPYSINMDPHIPEVQATDNDIKMDAGLSVMPDNINFHAALPRLPQPLPFHNLNPENSIKADILLDAEDVIVAPQKLEGGWQVQTLVFVNTPELKEGRPSIKYKYKYK